MKTVKVLGTFNPSTSHLVASPTALFFVAVSFVAKFLKQRF